MADSLKELWQRLSLMEEEYEKGLVVEEDSERNNDSEHLLVGKLLQAK